MLVHQTRLSAGCVSTILALFLSSVGFSGEDLWLKNTAEATQLRKDGRYSEAEAKYLTAYRTVMDTAEEPVRRGISLVSLANLYSEMGRFVDAEAAAQGALAIYQKISEPKSTGLALAQVSLAEIYRIQGKYVPAEQLCIQALAAYEAAAPTKENGLAHGAALNNLAILRLSQQRLSAAEPLLKRALDILERTQGPDDYSIATTQNNLVTIYLALGRFVEARRALAVLERAQAPRPEDLAITINNLAALSARRKQYTEAQAFLERALDILARAFGPQHANLATILINLSVVYAYQGRYTDAEAVLRRALEIRVAAFGPESFPVAEVLYGQALLFRKLRRKSEAKKLKARALAIQAAHAQENLVGYTVDLSALQAGRERH